MRRVPTLEVKERTKKVSAIFQSQFPYTHKLGERCTVLITEEAKDGVHMVGHNKRYVLTRKRLETFWDPLVIMR